jgi:hypothetical protein
MDLLVFPPKMQHYSPMEHSSAVTFLSYTEVRLTVVTVLR